MQLPNGVGQYRVGIDPIGDLPFDWYGQTVISQYANSPALLAILQSFADATAINQQIDQFFDSVWNIQTAIGWGLDVWGRIVGVNRTVQVSSVFNFGFSEALPSADTFGPGGASPFYSGGTITSNYQLSDTIYRNLILAKAAANIWDGSINGLNAILRLMFPGEKSYVIDNLNMTMTYQFDWTPTTTDLAIINSSGVLPRPCGVSYNVIHL